MNLARTCDPVLPTPQESATARKAMQRITPFLAKANNIGIRVPGLKETVPLPAVVGRLLEKLLSEVAKGNAVTVVPVHTELTTRQAAELLGISRPFLVEQLEAGRLPFHKVGTHRRVSVEDVTRLKCLFAQVGKTSDETVGAEIKSHESPMAKKFRRLSIDALGRSSPRGFVWTAEQDALLGLASDREIAGKLGCSVSPVSLRRKRLGIPPHHPPLAFSRVSRLKADTIRKHSVLGK